jgi:hypothetical protein
MIHRINPTTAPHIFIKHPIVRQCPLFQFHRATGVFQTFFECFRLFERHVLGDGLREIPQHAVQIEGAEVRAQVPQHMGGIVGDKGDYVRVRLSVMYLKVGDTRTRT